MNTKTLVFVLSGLLIACSAAFGARILSYPIYQDPIILYSVYPGKTCDGAGNTVFKGLSNQPAQQVVEVVPGILAIDPGGTEPTRGWSNFVSAGKNPGGPPDNTWTVINVALQQKTPRYTCSIPLEGPLYYRQGSDNIRRWWPLMYTLPGTEWVLTISYKTKMWDDDGPAGPNLPSTAHQDVWTWRLETNLDSLQNLIKMFYQIPVGKCKYPLITGKDIYNDLLRRLDRIKSYPDANSPQYIADLYDFILMVEDCCLTVDCGDCVPMQGIQNTMENPACCKILADAEYIFLKTACP
ncbi:MAG: hypothetical protein ACOX3G_11290 [Armatimonadota bacterium]|jgi:hypothetical protein